MRKNFQQAISLGTPFFHFVINIDKSYYVHPTAFLIQQTNIVSAKYVMKTDDDAFVRVDEVLASLDRINVTHGLLYGLINLYSQPHRSPDSKWFISPEVIVALPFLYSLGNIEYLVTIILTFTKDFNSANIQTKQHSESCLGTAVERWVSLDVCSLTSELHSSSLSLLYHRLKKSGFCAT